MAKCFPKLFVAAGVVALMAGCTVPTKNVDRVASKINKPRSIVVLPPLNGLSNVGTTYNILSRMTVPLTEAGYYVLPIVLVDEAFHQNGLNTAGDIHDMPVTKLHDIFGIDVTLYITVTQYGSKYMVVNSSTVVSADVKLVDLKSGQTLWTDRTGAPNNEGRNNSGGGLVGMLMSAAVNQIVTNVADQGYKVTGTTSACLLSAEQSGGLLYDPHPPKYGTN